MSSQFQAANEAALLSVGARVEYDPATRRWNSVTHALAPTLDSDGAPIGGAVVGILAAKTGTAGSGQIILWLYTGAPGVEGEGWVVPRGGALTATDEGLTERITLAGYKRVYVQWVSAPGLSHASIGFGVSR